MADVFISYSRADAATAAHLTEMLKKDGLSVFYDQDSLVAGESYSAAIQRALLKSRAVVVLLSRNSKRSKYVEEELRVALEEGNRVIIPVLLDKEATENWIWPLVSNRQAITLESPQDISKVARAIELSMGKEDGGIMPPPPPSALPSRYYWLIAIFSILSALVSAIVVWLLR